MVALADLSDGVPCPPGVVRTGTTCSSARFVGDEGGDVLRVGGTSAFAAAPPLPANRSIGPAPSASTSACSPWHSLPTGSGFAGGG